MIFTAAWSPYIYIQFIYYFLFIKMHFQNLSQARNDSNTLQGHESQLMENKRLRGHHSLDVLSVRPLLSILPGRTFSKDQGERDIERSTHCGPSSKVVFHQRRDIHHLLKAPPYFLFSTLTIISMHIIT